MAFNREKMREKRKEIGIPQFKLAGVLGVSIATVRRWEAGQTEPTASQLSRIAEILRILPGELFESDGRVA